MTKELTAEQVAEMIASSEHHFTGADVHQISFLLELKGAGTDRERVARAIRQGQNTTAVVKLANDLYGKPERLAKHTKKLREEVGELSHYDSNIIDAFFEYLDGHGGIKEKDTAEDIQEKLEECFVGEFGSDGDFAEDMAEQCEQIDQSAGWPHNCIDWERAARDLMYDYYEVDGCYFRHL